MVATLEERLLADFTDVDVLNAVNPSEYGFHHGPIRNGSAALLSRVNTLVCTIQITRSGKMCGRSFKNNAALYRHIRQCHVDVVRLPSKANTSDEERMFGENAIRLWVMTGGWRDARFVREPDKIPAHSLLLRFATRAEHLASINPKFAKKYGKTFHRPAATSPTLAPQVPSADSPGGESSPSKVEEPFPLGLEEPFPHSNEDPFSPCSDKKDDEDV